MASEVSICNLALSNLGDSANVTSISPPEGSPQAEHCARFYPLARDVALEDHAWGFATVRAAMAQIQGDAGEWAFLYAMPGDVVTVQAVLAPGSSEPQKFVREAAANGTDVILTNQPQAVIKFTTRVTDPNRFSPRFVDALSWLLASKLAGPLLKDDTGRKAALAAYQTYLALLGRAAESDANQQSVERVNRTPSWIAAR